MRTVFVLFVLILSSPAMAQVGPLGLEDLVQKALAKNADLLNQRSEAHISGLERWQALSRALPQADAEAGYVKTSGQKGTPDFVGANGLKEKIAWLAFQQTIFDAGTLVNIFNARIAQKQQALLSEQTRQDVLLQVIEAYFSALQAREEVSVYRANLKAFKLMYEQSRQLFATGMVPELDVKKSHVEYLLQENALTKSQAGYRSALNRVKALIGMAMADSLRLKPFPHRAVHLDSLSVYLRAAASSRPDLKVARLESDALRNARRAALMERFPVVDAGAYYGWDTNDPLRADNRGWQAYLSVRMPLWHWGHLHTDRQIAEIRYQQSETRREQMQRQVAREVISAFSDCRVQRQHMQVMAESRGEAADAARMARFGYQEGTVTNLDVITAQQLLTQTRLEYLQAEYAFYSAKARLSRRIGNLREDLSWLE